MLEDVNFAIPTAAVVKSAGFVALYYVCAAPARWACTGFIKKSITRAVDEFGEEEEAMAVEPPQAPPAGALVLHFAFSWWFVRCVFSGSSNLEEALLKIMGKQVPIEEMDMEEAMSAAGLKDLYDLEVSQHLVVLGYSCAVCCMTLCPGLATRQRLQRAPEPGEKGAEAHWQGFLCAVHLC